MNEQQLISIMPNARASAGIFLPALVAAMAEFQIDRQQRQADFLATVGQETGQLTALEENLNYGAAGLLATWPGRFDAARAVQYARQPQRIASLVYAGRGGNGDEATGDGWLFRGAGGIMITFRDGHTACAKYFGIPLPQLGAWLRTPEGACRSAGWFWAVNRINGWSDAGDFDGVCDVVNIGRKTDKVGDAIGYAGRAALRATAMRVLA
jgi:putative chitinase